MEPDSSDPLDQTKVFVSSLSSVINSMLLTTGAEGFGGSQQGATEVFADELDAVAQLSSGAATTAFMQLKMAVIDAGDALAAGETGSLEGTGVSGSATLSADSNTLTVTGASSTATDGTDSVTITVDSGSRVEDGTSGSLSMTGVTMETSQSDSVVQTFTGDITLTFSAEGDDLGLSAVTFNGSVSVAADAGSSFAINATLSNITGTPTAEDTTAINGDYTASFTFMSSGTDDLNIALEGALHGLNQSYSASTGTTTIWGTASRDGSTDTDTLTDMTATLTLVLDLANGQLVSGTFTVGSEETGTLDDTGLVVYSDGSAQYLPAAIF